MKLNPDSFIFEVHELFSEEYYLHFTGAVLTDEITEKLVAWGTTSVSVSPDMIDITRDIIAKAEARLGIK